MKGLPQLVVLLALASLLIIHVRDNPALWSQLVSTRAGEKTDSEPVEVAGPAVEDTSAEDLSEKGKEKDEEPLYKDTLDEADEWIGKAAVEYRLCAVVDAKDRAGHADRLLEYTDEALNVLDWLNTVYPDHQDIEERMEETYKMRQAALRFGAGN